MKTLKILNSSDREIGLLIEPIAHEYTIESKKTIELNTDSSEITIEYFSDNFISLWSDRDVSIFSDGGRIYPNLPI